MHITLLGTGTSQGIPVVGCNCVVCVSAATRDKRLRTSALLQTDQTTVLIDCGPDFRQQMLMHNVQKLDAVLLTHDHQDHVAGLDELRAFIFKQQRPMPIYAESNVLAAIKRRFDYAFAKNPYPGAPVFELHTLTPGNFIIGDMALAAIRVMHGKLPILGFRAGDFAYLTDVNHVPKASEAALQNLQILVLDSLHHTPHHSHYNLAQALEEIKTLAPKKAYLTHISHNMGLHAEVEANLPQNVFLAYDGLTFDPESLRSRDAC